MNAKKILTYIIISVLLTNLLSFNFTVSASSKEYDISQGDVTISGSGSYSVNGTSRGNSITVNKNSRNVKIILSDVTINARGGTPIYIGDGAEVILELTGNNTLTAGSGCAGIRVGSTSSLTICGSGSLSVTGGSGAAGIGGEENAGSGTINIEEGTISAVGGNDGAGIGGGNGGNGGTIDISGGTVSAYGGGDACGIGSGASASGSSISIDADFNVTAFSESNSEALETSAMGSLRTQAAVLLDFSSVSLNSNSKLVVSGNERRTASVMSGCKYAGMIFESSGSYSVTAGGSALSVQDGSAISSKMEVGYGVNRFTLTKGCSCELTKPDFSVSNVYIDDAKQGTKKTVKLSASGSVLKLSDSCTIHSDDKVTYSYEIVRDEEGIAEIKDNVLTIYAYSGGKFPITVAATATAGGFSATTESTFSVICSADDYNVNFGSVVIDKEGEYILSGKTTANTITVKGGLGIVDLTLKNLEIDFSKNSKVSDSPLYVGAGTELRLHVDGESSLISNQKGIPICIEPGTSKSNRTEVTIDAYGGTLNLTNPSSNTAIGAKKGGQYIYIGFLTGKVNIRTRGGPAVGTIGAEDDTQVFVSDKVSFQALTTSNTVAPIAGNVVEIKSSSYNPAYLVEGTFTGKFVNEDSTLIFRDTSSGNEVTIKEFMQSDLSFVVALPRTRTVYNILYKDSFGVERYVSHTEKKDMVATEFVVMSPYTRFEIFTSACKCTLSAPTLKTSAVSIAYDDSEEEIELNAYGSQLKRDENCSIHTGQGVTYRYSILSDEGGIASLSDNILKIHPKNPGKYTLKIKVNAYSDGLSSEKTVSINVTKLSADDTTKKLGNECLPFMNGYEDGSFRPDAMISRGEAAAIVSRLVSFFDEDEQQDEYIADVSTDSWYYKYIAFLVSECFMSCYPDGTFRPDDAITRGDFAAAVCQSQYIEPVTKGKSKLTDIDGHWANGYINALYKKKYITGYEDNTFKPYDPITRAEVVVVVNRILKRKVNKQAMDEQRVKSQFSDVDKKHWAYYEIILGTVKYYEKQWK